MKGFARFANVTSGLQLMIESASDEARQSWAFDAGSQYYRRLKSAALVPNASLAIHSWHNAPDRVSGIEMHAYSLKPTLGATEPSWQADVPAPTNLQVIESTGVDATAQAVG